MKHMGLNYYLVVATHFKLLVKKRLYCLVSIDVSVNSCHFLKKTVFQVGDNQPSIRW